MLAYMLCIIACLSIISILYEYRVNRLSMVMVIERNSIRHHRRMRIRLPRRKYFSSIRPVCVGVFTSYVSTSLQKKQTCRLASDLDNESKFGCSQGVWEIHLATVWFLCHIASEMCSHSGSAVSGIAVGIVASVSWKYMC